MTSDKNYSVMILSLHYAVCVLCCLIIMFVASPGPSSRVSLASFDKIKDESDDEFFDAQGK